MVLYKKVIGRWHRETVKGQRHSPVSNEGGDISVNGRYLNIYCALAVSQDCWWKWVWEKEQHIEETTALSCAVRAGAGTGYKPDGSHQASRNFQTIPAAEAMDSFQISSSNVVKLYLLQFICKTSVFFSGRLCVNGITGVNILLLESDTWYTGQFFCHYRPGTLQPFKWTIKKSRFILPNLRLLTLDTPVRSRVSLTCVGSWKERQM